MLSKKFAYLPDEIIRQILCYTDVYKERNGRLMSQIPKDDPRYAIIQTIFEKMKDTFSQNYDYGIRIDTTYIILKTNFVPDCNIVLRVSISETTSPFPTPKYSLVTKNYLIRNKITHKVHSYHHIVT
jgi:hypothetical protein